MLKHYVEYLLPGILFSESSVEEIEERDPVVARQKMDVSFGFRFFDKTVEIIDDETLEGDRKNFSGWYYEGEKLTLEDVWRSYAYRGDPNNFKTLLDNMICNDYAAVVKTKYGQCMPLKDGDTVL